MSAQDLIKFAQDTAMCAQALEKALSASASASKALTKWANNTVSNV